MSKEIIELIGLWICRIILLVAVLYGCIVGNKELAGTSFGLLALSFML